MGNWTPGPWEYIDASKSARYRFAPNCVIRGNGKQIASFSWGDPLYWPVKDESQANARLIAAAPELLEALTVAREWMRGDKWRNSTVEKHASWEAVMRGIDAAIAKATGAHA